MSVSYFAKKNQSLPKAAPYISYDENLRRVLTCTCTDSVLAAPRREGCALLSKARHSITSALPLFPLLSLPIALYFPYCLILLVNSFPVTFELCSRFPNLKRQIPSSAQGCPATGVPTLLTKLPVPELSLLPCLPSHLLKSSWLQSLLPPNLPRPTPPRP